MVVGVCGEGDGAFPLAAFCEGDDVVDDFFCLVAFHFNGDAGAVEVGDCFYLVFCSCSGDFDVSGGDCVVVVAECDEFFCFSESSDSVFEVFAAFSDC